MDLLSPITPEEAGLVSELKSLRKRLTEKDLEYGALVGQLQDCYRTAAEVVKKAKDQFCSVPSTGWLDEDVAELLTEIENRILELGK